MSDVKNKQRKRYTSKGAFTKEEAEFIKKCLDDPDGPSVREIAIEIGRSPGSVHQYSFRNGWRRGKHNIPDGHKRCSMCKEILPYDMFHYSKQYTDNKDSLCKMCKKLKHFDYRQKKIRESDEDRYNNVRNCPEDGYVVCGVCGERKYKTDYYLYKKDYIYKACKKCKGKKRYTTKNEKLLEKVKETGEVM